MPKLEKQRWVRIVQLDGYGLRCVPLDLRADRKIVLAGVAHGGNALEYAAAELRGDREIVLAAVCPPT